MPTIPLTPRVRQPRIRWRRSVEKLSPDQLGHVREAYRWAESITDDRGYQTQAGIHGLPLPISCKHSNDQQFANLFLPWHRAYLYFFERALRDGVATVAQPWWDWTHPSAANEGIPGAYADARADGDPNPLHSVQINDVAMAQAQQAGIDLPAQVQRDPGLPGSRLPTTGDVENVLAIPDFFTFSHVLEDLHGTVHGYVGGRTGHMSQVPLAAYDPIFWAHHSMIDRLWRMWQLRHPPPDFTADFLNTALPPFPMTVAQTLDVRALGYDYASGGSSVQVNG